MTISNPWPTVDPPAWLPIWLANMETFIAGESEEENEWRSYLCVLNYFSGLGLAWLDSTHVADSLVARRALGRALRHFARVGDLRELTHHAGLVSCVAFAKRGSGLLRSLRPRARM